MHACGSHSRLTSFGLLQVKSSTRSSITIPERSWARFRDIFADYVEKMSPSSAANAEEKSKEPRNGNSK